MLKTVPWLKGFGGMIVSEKDTDIMKLNVDELKQCLAKDKAIMLRGFDTNHEIFKKFTDQFSKKFLLHFSPHVRPNMGDDATITGVLIGNERVHLHGEMNYSPVRPEILFLHCTIPSAVGGETTLCDGRAFYLALPEELKKLFESKKIKYIHKRTQEEYQKVYGWKTPQEAIAGFTAMGYTSVKEVENKGVGFEFITSGVFRSGPNEEFVFINSLVNMKRSLRRITKVFFEDGSEISEELVDQIDQIGESIKQGVKWQAKDIIFVDNKRVMHGRNAFQGERVIATRFMGAA